MNSSLVLKQLTCLYRNARVSSLLLRHCSSSSDDTGHLKEPYELKPSSHTKNRITAPVKFSNNKAQRKEESSETSRRRPISKSVINFKPRFRFGENDGSGELKDAEEGKRRSYRRESNPRERFARNPKAFKRDEHFSDDYHKDGWRKRSQSFQDDDGDGLLAFDREKKRNYQRKRNSSSEFSRREDTGTSVRAEKYSSSYGYNKGDDRRTPSQPILPDTKGEIVFGLYPTLLALQHKRRDCSRLHIKKDLLQSEKPVVQEIVRECREQGVWMKSCDVHMLDGLSGGRPHQGVCLDSSPIQPVKLDTEDDSVWASGQKPSLWLMLDAIQDPMNFGAILRSAYFLGVDKVLTGEQNSCALSPVVSKASAGVLEVMPVYKVKDTLAFLKKAQERGYQILGTSGESHTDATVTVGDYPLNRDAVLVLGNEGLGVSKEVLDVSDVVLTIKPSRDLLPGVDSLNVSVATGILLHSLLSSRSQQ